MLSFRLYVTVPLDAKFWYAFLEVDAQCNVLVHFGFVALISIYNLLTVMNDRRVHSFRIDGRFLACCLCRAELSCEIAIVPKC